MELGGVWARAAKVQKASHEKEKNFFRALFLKPQVKVGSEKLETLRRTAGMRMASSIR